MEQYINGKSTEKNTTSTEPTPSAEKLLTKKEKALGCLAAGALVLVVGTGMWGVKTGFAGWLDLYSNKTERAAVVINGPNTQEQFFADGTRVVAYFNPAAYVVQACVGGDLTERQKINNSAYVDSVQNHPACEDGMLTVEDFHPNRQTAVTQTP